MTQSTYGKIGLATLIMMGSIFLSRVLGVLRESTIAAMGGAGTAVDAYKTAFILPEILNHVVAGGFLSITFIPIFSRYLAQKDEAGGWRIFSNILTVFGLVLALLILIAMILTPDLIRLVAPGRSTDPLFLAMTVRMTRIVLPAQFFFFAGGLFMAVQFAKERFFLPALAPLVYNLGIISGGVLFSKQLGVEGFSWGALVGAGIGSFIIQGIGARRAGMRYGFRMEIRHPDLRRYILLTLPLILGLTMTFSTEMFSKYFGSYLPPGGISWLDYALRIVMVLVAFFGQALGVASFPFLSKLAAENHIGELNRMLATILRTLALIIPVSLLVWVLRGEIIRVLFQRMAFTGEDAAMTALALSGLLVGATAFAAQGVVNRGFYATQNTLLPAICSTVTTVLCIPLYWIGLTALGVPGLGLAISLAALVQVVVIYSVWNRTSHNDTQGAVFGFYGKMLILSLTLAPVLWVSRRLVLHLMPDGISLSSFWFSLGMIAILGIWFLALMGAIGWIFKIPEILAAGHRLRLHFGKR